MARLFRGKLADGHNRQTGSARGWLVAAYHSRSSRCEETTHPPVSVAQAFKHENRGNVEDRVRSKGRESHDAGQDSAGLQQLGFLQIILLCEHVDMLEQVAGPCCSYRISPASKAVRRL